MTDAELPYGLVRSRNALHPTERLSAWRCVVCRALMWSARTYVCAVCVEKHSGRPLGRRQVRLTTRAIESLNEMPRPMSMPVLEFVRSMPVEVRTDPAFPEVMREARDCLITPQLREWIIGDVRTRRERRGYDTAARYRVAREFGVRISEISARWSA